MKKPARPVLLHVVLPLVAGLVIYLLFRSGTWLHGFLLPASGRGPVLPPADSVTRIIAFNLPDFCWCYSFASVLFLWEKWQKNNTRLLPVAVFILLLANEGVQYFLPSSFTFDWADVIAAVLAFILSVFQIRKNEKI